MSVVSGVLAEIQCCIRQRRSREAPFIVFVTGIDASGKTHLATRLRSYLEETGEHCELVHLDDFHHPQSHRYGGDGDQACQYFERSFDLDLLVNEILVPLRRNGRLSKDLRLIDILKDTRTTGRTYCARPDSIVILEGVFLFRPELIAFADLSVYLSVPFEESLGRARTRDIPVFGEAVLDKYFVKYFPAQLRYERACRPHECADIVIDNTNFQAPSIIRRDGGAERPSAGEISNAIKVANRKYDAVLFDLWDTLVPMPAEIKREAFVETARILDRLPEQLQQTWERSRQERESGDLHTFLVKLCSQLRVPDAAEKAAKIIDIRRQVHGRAMSSPRPDAEITLRMLQAFGYKTAVISNCTSDVREMLAGTSLVHALDWLCLSCTEGLVKPNPELFSRAADRIGIRTDRCLYVGDGNDAELAGASAAGMIPLLLETEQIRVWNGARLKRLSDVFHYVPV